MAKGTADMPLLLELADQLIAAGARPQSPQERESLVVHVLDTVGATICGSATPDGRAALGFKMGSSAIDQVARNCTVTRLSEIDDIHLPSGCTPGSIIVPSAITMAGHLKVTDPALFAAALIAGYEAITRLGAAVDGQSIVYKGILTTYFAAPFGTAAVTARLLGLDVEQTAHALSMALTLLSGRIGQPGNKKTARWLMIGQAARAGCFAALAAEDGFRGDLGLLDGEWIENAHGLTTDRTKFIKEKDTPIVVPDISVKPYCSAKQMVAAIAGFEDLLARGIDPYKIEKILVIVPERYAKMIDHGVVEGNRLSSVTSAPYQLSLAAHHKRGLYDVARTTYALTDDVTTLMGKIFVEVDTALDNHLPNRWPARVHVEAGDRCEEVTIVDAPGDPGRAFDLDKTIAKFNNFTSGVLDADHVAFWRDHAVAALDNEDALQRLQQNYLNLGRD